MATLGVEALAAVVLVTVVVVTVLVAAAGFIVGFIDGSAAGSVDVHLKVVRIVTEN